MELPVTELQDKRNGTATNFKENMINFVGLIQDIMSGLSQEQLRAGNTVLSKSSIPTMSLAINAYFGFSDQKTLIEKFIKGSYIHWDRFFSRDEQFFIKHAKGIFGELPGASDYLDILVGLFQPRRYANQLDSVGVILTDEEKVAFYQCPKEQRMIMFSSKGSRYGHSYISDDNMEAIIDFFHALISICLRYIHLQRNPFEVIEIMPDKSGKMYRFYLTPQYPELNLTEMNQKVMETYRCDLSYHVRQELNIFRETLKSGYLSLLTNTSNPGLPYVAVKYLTPEQLQGWRIRLDHDKRLIYLNEQPYTLLNLDRSLWDQAVSTITDNRLVVIKQYSTVVLLTAK